MKHVRLSADELARLAEVEAALVQRVIQAGALQQRETAGGFTIQDAARLRFLKAWEAAGLPVETIGDLIARGELPFSFMDVPVMAAQPRLPSTYQEATLRLLRTYADALRRLTQAEADLYEFQVEEPGARPERPSRTCWTPAA